MAFNGKSYKKSGHHVGVQLTMLDDFVSDPGPSLKEAMSEAISRCSLSREQIVDDMNRLAAVCGITCNGNSQKVTIDILNKWVAAGSFTHNIPIRLLPIFCRAVGSNLPLEVYATAFIGARVIPAEEYKILEWGKAEIECRKARKIQRRISAELGIE